MESRGRAVALGVLAGVGDALVRLYVGSPAPVSSPPGVERVVAITLFATVLALAATVGLPLVGAYWTRPRPESPVRLAATLGGAAGLAAAVVYLLVTARYVGALYLEAVRIRLVGPYLVDALATAVYAGLAGLAGFALASRNE